ncbi:MAG: hypothetical protein WBE76_11005 [Terracidiphilus sp.]
MNPYEPLPRELLPKDLRDLPDLAAHELYIYRAVSRGPARLLVKEIEDSQRKRMGIQEVEFRLHDIVLYFARVAGEGIIGNLAYAVVSRVIQAVRRPKKEILGSNLLFETTISKKTYKRLREEKHPRTRPTLKATPTFEETAETQYKLMVTLKRTPSKKLPKKSDPADNLFTGALLPIKKKKLK